MRQRLAAVVALLAAVGAAWAIDQTMIEDWTEQELGHTGVPERWQPQSWGRPTYDFTIVEDDGRRVLHLKSARDSSTIIHDIRGEVDLKDTPILEWSWKAVTLPKGADARKKATDDEAAQIYVAWPRFPEAVRSRIIGYIWDTTAPVGTVVKSGKTSTVTYVVVRSGTADLNRWITERRNVAEDFKTIYGATAESPGAVSVGIDSDDTDSTAESFMGPIRFIRR